MIYVCICKVSKQQEKVQVRKRDLRCARGYREYSWGLKVCKRSFLGFLRVRYEGLMIQVDIGGHPPFPTGSKQFSGNFGNLLFLAVFNFRGHFEDLNEGFL
jgi:hypothetical protein